MSRVRYIVPRKVLLMLYNTLIYPYLVYCNIAWGNASCSLLNSLFVLQKRAVRICSGSSYRSSSSPLYYKLRLLKLADINSFQTLLFMYKIKFKLVPHSCMHFASINSASRVHITRRLSYFTRIKFRTNIRSRSLSVQGPKLWDLLPSDLQSENSLGSFKHKLVNHYISGY